MASLSRLTPGLDDLLKHVVDALPAPVGRAVVAPGGSVAWDDCCDGQAWVRVVSVEPSYQARCGIVRWTVTLGIGVLRCAAVLNDDGVAPSPRQITADGHEMIADMDAIAHLFQCNDLPLDPLLGNWTPQGPNGGCHGGEWAATVTLLS